MEGGSPFETWAELEFVDEFDVLPEHIALLRRAHSGWQGDDWGGAPGLNPKRPFGGSDVYDDIAAIVDGRTDGRHDPAEEARYDRLFGELALVLEIVLQSGSFEPGCYVCRAAGGGGWRRAAGEG